MCTPQNMYGSLFIVIIFNLYMVSTWQEKPGEYKVVPKGLEKCPDSDQLPIQCSYKIRRYNRSVVTYSSIVESPYDLDDTLSITIDVAKKGNGGYKDNYYNVKLDNVCTMIKKYVPHVMKDVVQRSGINTNSCPIPKGKYYLDNYIINIGKIQTMPVAFYGEFRGELRVYKQHKNGTEEKLFCLRVLYEIKPK